jgi:hypothetical protein
MQNKRSSVELASIFADRAEHFLASNRYALIQKNAFNDILQCRTAALGGHLQGCDSCSNKQQAYNSCRNRHCPKCQFVKKAKWVDKLSGNLPPVKYFHLVFTIPECLNALFYINQKQAYHLLFQAAGKALTQCAKNTNYLGANPGAVAILHTWGQTLVYHPHIHMIVPAGGFSEDQTEWIPSNKKFFLPVKILSAVFRGILCRSLEKAIENKKIVLPNQYTSFQQLKERCYKTNWVVYSEKPFANPQNLINYLGNYTHRVAISNQRILEHKDGKVTFHYKDNKTGGLRKKITLDQDEFIRRFLQHVLPSGFSKIRYFGFMALRHLQANIEQCIALLEKNTLLPELVGLNAYEVYRQLFEKDPQKCSKCKSGKLNPLIIKKPVPT